MADPRPRITASAAVFVLTLFATTTISAQIPSPIPTAQQPTANVRILRPKWSLEKKFFKNLLRDQEVIWTSPLHLHLGDAVWLAPLAGGTAILIATDKATTEEGLEFSANPTHARISADISDMGSGYATAGVCGAFYLFGLIDDNDKAHETGLVAAEALIDSAIVGEALKEITQRPRPHTSTEPGEFFSGGDSFPSGHSLAAWSVATVVAMEYHKHLWVKLLAYTLAAAVSTSRFTGSNHFLSDILIGSAIGFGTGRYVYHQRHDPALDGGDGTKGRWAAKLIPRIAPQLGGTSLGISALWSF
jgi:membrane-associated phospholipid phosphatase